MSTFLVHSSNERKDVQIFHTNFEAKNIISSKH